MPASFRKYYSMWKARDISSTDFTKLVEVSRMTVYKYFQMYENGLEKLSAKYKIKSLIAENQFICICAL